jgi:hypothetical protein
MVVTRPLLVEEMARVMQQARFDEARKTIGPNVPPEEDDFDRAERIVKRLEDLGVYPAPA